MITCADFMAELGNYMDDTVADEVRMQLDNHLVHCPTCQVIVDSTRKTVRIVSDSGSFDLPDAVLKRITVGLMAKIRDERG